MYQLNNLFLPNIYLLPYFKLLLICRCGKSTIINSSLAPSHYINHSFQR